MNILEAYIKKYKQLIILILGLPCTNKSEIAKELANDLNIEIIKINDFLIDNKYNDIDIDGTKIKLYEDSKNYDWNKLNLIINESKSNGVILYGNYLDLDKIDSKIDFIFFYSMNIKTCKKILIEKKIVDSKITNSILDKFFDKIYIPLYENLKKNIKINKFYNLKEDSKFDESYDDLFDFLMNLIHSKLK